MFLDFDGTLAELAEHPDLVVVDGRLRPVLQELSRALDGALAIVSGRPIEQLDALRLVAAATLRLPGAGPDIDVCRELEQLFKRTLDQIT